MESGLSTGGILFMLLAWLGIILLNVYCYRHIFRERREKIVGPLEVEADIDAAGE